MPGTKAVPALLRTINERAVLDAIRASAPISRAELARQTGISKPTVSLALRTLLEDGLVRETSHDPDRPHFGAVYYEAAPEAALVLGVDLGAHVLRTALCDLHGDVRARQDLRCDGGIDERIEAIGRTAGALLETSGLPAELLDLAVVGVPAVVSPADGRISDADLPGLETADLREQLERRLGVPVTLENDVNLAALGAQRRGAAQGVDDFAFLLVGDGLGAAVVLDGGLHRGSNGAAGELDAVRSGRSDDDDPCAAALSAYAARLAKTRSTSLEPPYEPRAILAAARTGDDVAQAVVVEEGRRIALHVLALAATLDLPLVVLGGDIGANGDLLLGPVRRHLEEWLAFPPRLESSQLGEAAVLSGALAAGLDAALEHVFQRRLHGQD
jgi:predicted NBD/HSP70 family sugar kinase